MSSSEEWRKREKELGTIFVNTSKHVVITFSGGKDSTALTLLTIRSAILLPKQLRPERISIIYTDTQVDPLPLTNTVNKSFKIFKKLGKELGLNIHTELLSPPLKDNFWILLIGKGYPPPSFNFRWCTERLKIKPIKAFLREIQTTEGYLPLLLTGVRMKESSNRHRTLAKKIENGKWIKFAGLKECWMYAPLLYSNAGDVWGYIEKNERFFGIDFSHLRYLYSFSPDGCNTYRTGCWVCTVVKQDRSLEMLAKQDPKLALFAEFRRFLRKIRDDKSLREMRRNNVGKIYRGPLKMEVRKKILKKLEEFYCLPQEVKMEIWKFWR